MADFKGRLRRWPAEMRAALAFFSRLPVRAPDMPFDLRRSAACWPLTGFVIALGPAALFLFLRDAAAAPPLLAALLSLAAVTALTGGMHEDGLADTADGFGGGHSPVDKLAIMQDSRIGTYGVLALSLGLLIKATALAHVGIGGTAGALALVGVAVQSRALALGHWFATLPARREGLAWSAGRPDAIAFAAGVVPGLFAAAALVVFFGPEALVALVIGVVAVWLFSRVCSRQIGGHTGDTVGAAQQVAEIALLAGLACTWTPGAH